MKDVKPAYDNVPYAFIGAPAIMSKQLVKDKLNESGISVEETEHVLDLLVWFGVLGIYLADEEERYSYQFEHDPEADDDRIDEFRLLRASSVSGRLRHYSMSPASYFPG